MMDNPVNAKQTGVTQHWNKAPNVLSVFCELLNFL